MAYMIVQRKNRNAVYARGFWKLERAEEWLAKYDPRQWMEKNVQAQDLEIVDDPLGA